MVGKVDGRAAAGAAAAAADRASGQIGLQAPAKLQRQRVRAKRRTYRPSKATTQHTWSVSQDRSRRATGVQPRRAMTRTRIRPSSLL